ncbi:MAG: ABC-F family ATP-binding cassette domain-containing protein [Bacteroidota bacterium]|nr:ABC-F family ATP-binding cassette domain-containing protein [Bacteroidota bacterium]
MNFIKAENLSKAYGDKTLFEDITFKLNRYEKVGLIAKNGTGKTTLLNIITGGDIADSGSLFVSDEISIGYLPQEPFIELGYSVMDTVLDSEGDSAKAFRIYQNAAESEDAEKMQQASVLMDKYDAWGFEQEIKIILDKLQLYDMEREAATMSGGEKKRIALAKILIKRPNLLILDEPTNHLDFEMIAWLEDYIAKMKVTVLLVTHDRYFLDKICNKILEIDHTELFEYTGNYKYFLHKREDRIEQFIKESEDVKRELKKESEWAKRMPKARGTKAKYRLENYERLKTLSAQKRDDSALSINVKTKRLGKKIIDVYGISKSFGDKVLIEDFSYKFSQFQKAAIVGNNGTGKSTLLRMFTQELKPDKGSVDVGETVTFGFYTQEGLKFGADDKVIDAITNVAEKIETKDGSYLSAAVFLEYFLFPRYMHYSFISGLSGGEKKRLYLLTVLMKNPNFLVLDEPTNDLDIATLEVLESYLKQFKGNVLVVSHDRYFTDEVADTLFVLDDTGRVGQFPGKYSDYLRKLKAERAKSTAGSKKKPSKNKESSKSSNSKMTYKEKKEFEAVEKNIEAMTVEKEQIETELSGGELDVEDIPGKSKRLSELNENIDEAEFRWLELSEKEM